MVRVPRWNGRGVSPNFHSGYEFHARLARQIADLWRAEGAQVDVRVVNISQNATPVYGIRSNLLNGLPRKK